MRACIKHDHVSTLSPFISSYFKEDQAIVGIPVGSQANQWQEKRHVSAEQACQDLVHAVSI